MKHAIFTSGPSHLVWRFLASTIALIGTSPAFAAQTDISSTPIISTTPAQVKPNIMLLMDASGSMGRTHMPDEVETQTGPTSVGYKSWQCNALYYNPAQAYTPPKTYTGAFFAVPSFTAAPYAGFVSYYPAPTATELSSTDLSSSFVAYDQFTLDQVSPFPDTPQAAYYYLYTGAQVLGYATAPCTDPYLGTVTQAATGGGTWTRVTVSATSGPGATDERQNFAIWYSFYRTRLSLIKSAASLAFTPLTDSFRVGFITVSPKAAPTDAAIDQARYLAINDFDSTQRDAWFRKLFSQSPGGASPAREGLARVGRHYAGKQDSINNGMAGDPVQYSCQQNFTIMTTDGYWNAQTETPTGAGLYGGGLALDGTTLVGQQDGDPFTVMGTGCFLNDPFCPRPIWDGVASSIQTSTTKSNAYSEGTCAIAGQLKSTAQTTQATSQIQMDSTRTTQRTLQYLESKVQNVATTTQTVKSVDQTTQVTKQFVVTTDQYIERQYQVWKSQDQTTKVTQQFQLQTQQVTQQSFQTSKLVEQTTQHTEQWQTATQQFATTTTQYSRMQTQYQQSKVQTSKHQYQVIAYDTAAEHGTAVSGACVAAGSIECRITEVFGPAFVDPSTCAPGVGAGPGYVRTDCTAGPQTQATTAVTSCTPGTTNSGAPNWVVTTCNLVTTSADAPFNGTCTVGTTQGAGPTFFNTICSRPAANNVANLPVSSCTLGTTSTGAPNWITTTCSNPAGPNNQVATNSPACTVGTTSSGAPNYIATTCSKPTDTTAFSAPCVSNPGIVSPYTKITCTKATITPSTVVDASTCSAGTTGSPNYLVTTCTRVAAGPFATAAFAATCTAGYGSSPNWYETACTYVPGANNATAFVASCAPGTSSSGSPNYITSICTNPAGANNATTYSPPASCTPNPGTSAPYLKVDCTSANLMPPTVVDPATCTPIGTTVGAGPNFIVTTCQEIDLGAVPVGACAGPTVGPPPTYIVTVCGPTSTSQAVASCVLGTTNTGPPNFQTITCSNPAGPNNLTQYVPFGTCSPQTAAAPNWVERTCSGPTLISGPVAVDPSTCTAGSGSSPNFFHTVCTTSPAGPYAAATGVPTCSAGTGPGPNFYVTTCANPGATNYANTPVSSCTPGSVTDGTETTTTCVYSDSGQVPVVGSSCSNQLPILGNGYKTVSCTTTAAATALPVASCTVGQSLAISPFDTTTACNNVPLTGYTDAASCTAGVGAGPAFVQTACSSRPLVSNVPDSMCAAGTDGAGVITTCTPSVGSGYNYFVATTTSVTTTPYSGAVPAGPGVTTTTTGATTPVDAVCYPTMQSFVAQPVPPLPCTVWPCVTSVAGANGSENSLADVAQYYYKTPLRTGPTWLNNVPAINSGPEDDNAPHIHMTTFVVGLGVSGTLNYRPDYRSTAVTTGDFADIRTGLKGWPVWPDPAINPANCVAGGPYTSCPMYDNPKSIDDFWHTAVNGRGTYFSAKDPTSVIQGLGDALAGIGARVASGSGDGASTLEPVAGNNFVYTSSYQTGSWQGDLEGFEVDLGTGALITPRLWSAQTLLNARTANACDDRNIYLIHPAVLNNLVEFTWNTDTCVAGVPAGAPSTALNGAEQGFFGTVNVQLLSQYPGMTDGTAATVNQRAAVENPNGFKLVNYLRGQRANEGFVSNSLTKLFRTRTAVLGDIVGSQPVYVKAPFASYQDPGYDTFKLNNLGRVPMVYTGANDGMLHAFYAGATATDPDRGKENWAIIPTAVLPNLYKLADADYANNHQFYVDGAPVIGDVYAGGAWSTVLVNGLNAGGKGYFAVDVTDPTALPPKVLWEFKANPAVCPATSAAAVGNTSDCNLGLTFGKPVITKIPDGTPDGKWVVMFASGYNNVNGASNGYDGVGFLYVVDATTGQIVYKIATTGGTAATPSGLAQINNYVDNVIVNNMTLRAYGGDVLGQIWRFEFSPTPSAQLIGTAADSGNAPQPITTRPELAELNGKPMIFVGTGKLLGATDISDVQTQSIYGISDPLTAGPVYADPLRQWLAPLTMTQVGTGAAAVRTVACSGTVAACARTDGWVVDLAEAGERVNVEMKLVLGTLIVGSNVPEPVACAIGGHSWFNYFDFKTGQALTGAALSDPNDPNSAHIVSQYLSDSLIVGFNIYRLPPPPGQNNGRFVAGVRTGDTGYFTPTPPVLPQPPSGRRISWREIVQ